MEATILGYFGIIGYNIGDTYIYIYIGIMKREMETTMKAWLGVTS